MVTKSRGSKLGKPEIVGGSRMIVLRVALGTLVIYFFPTVVVGLKSTFIAQPTWLTKTLLQVNISEYNNVIGNIWL
jgi:hypothetical protein